VSLLPNVRRTWAPVGRKTLYSVPWRLIGQRLDAGETQTTVQLFHQGELVATHVRKPAGKQTDMGHYPPDKIAVNTSP
jgi:hypothetical protein